MRLQRQTSFGGPGEPDPGNCWSTCLAMLLGLATAKVPNFCGLYPTDDGAWFRRAQKWLAPKGVALMSFNTDPATWDNSFRDTLCIASGPGPRGHLHSVLWRNGHLFHDPHPSGAGLLKALEFEVVVVADPDLFAAHLRLIGEDAGE